MRITDLINKQSVSLDAQVSSKKEALDTIIALMDKSGKISNLDEYKAKVYAREEEGTTGIGEGIAIPHGKCDAVKEPGLAAMVVKNGVDFDSLDNQPVYLAFLIAAPNTEDNVHLDLLSKLSVLMMNEKFVDDLKNAKTVDEFINIIDKAEAESDSKEERNLNGNVKCRILAVTGCPTGIAHTYMAAEALEKKAKELGCSIKVETRGSGGAKNLLTAEEISTADCIIVAADTKVPMDRFAGKKVIEVQVSDGISKSEELIKKAMSGDVKIYKSKGEENTQKQEGGSFLHQIYTHLMNGVSHMLPFVIGGGILIALAFLLDDYSLNPSNFGMNTPVAAFFKTIGGAAFSFMLPVLAGYIAMSIADRPGLVVGFVGGYIAQIGYTFTNLDSTKTIPAGFLGALLAGFIAGYLVLGIRKLCDYLPESLEGLKPILIYPLVGVLGIGVIMCAINPAVAGLNTALTNGLNSMGGSSKILLGCIVAGMMAIDMGGPFNKAAYVFGTGAIANGNYDIMAAVMIGGMVPPIAIALSTTFCKNKWSKSDRKAGIVNYIMGLCFITEGAIPFAAADPIRVIPSCIVGAAVAGGLSMAFKCTLMAPHGGVFVFPVVGNALLYLAALAVGCVVGALMLSALKKKVVE